MTEEKGALFIPPQPGVTDESLERRAKIAHLYRLGVLQIDIAKELEISETIVSRQLAAIRESWRKSAIIDFNEALGRELERIDWIELQACEGWEKSKKDLVVMTRYKNRDGDTVDELKKSNRDGDPRFLQQISWCSEQRARLLGLITNKQQVTKTETRIAIVEVIKSAPKQENDERPVLNSGE